MKKLAMRFSVWLIFLLVILYFQPIREMVDIRGEMTNLLLKIVTSFLHFMHVEVVRDGLFLHQPHSILEINDKCNGLILYSLYFAAVMSFPGSWMYKITWLLSGFLLIEAVNVFRVLCLSYIIEHWYSYFNFFHYVFFQGLLILTAMILIYFYMKNSKENHPNIT